jgi:LysM repeat protein
MGKEQLKKVFKSVRRFQAHFKFSLGLLLILVILVVGAAVYYQRHAHPTTLANPDHDIRLDASAVSGKNSTDDSGEKEKSTSSKSTNTESSVQKKSASITTTTKKLSFGKKMLKKTNTPLRSSQYVVKKGDSLWKISVKKYASGQHWPKIYQANARVIGSNPNLIHPHTPLVIPRVSLSRMR